LAQQLLSWDKAGHAVLYGALAVLVAMVVALRRPDRYLIGGLSLLACVWIVIGVSALGAFDEITQPLTNRILDWSDWVADTVGAALAVALFVLIHSWLRRLAPARPAAT
jgi:VanZ family protein